MCQIVDLQIDFEGMEFAVACGHAQVDDIGLVIAENPGNFAQRSRPVMDDDAEPRRRAVAALSPAQIDPVGIDSARQPIAAAQEPVLRRDLP